DAKKAFVGSWAEWPEVLGFDDWIANGDRHGGNFLIGGPLQHRDRRRPPLQRRAIQAARRADLRPRDPWPARAGARAGAAGYWNLRHFFSNSRPSGASIYAS